MIKFEHVEVTGWKAAIRGMRNPKESWDRGDSFICPNGGGAMVMNVLSIEELVKIAGTIAAILL